MKEDMDKEFEIPLGAKDSELKDWEYTIPDDMEAIIKNGKIIVRKKESEDEKIRKELIQYLKDFPNLPNGEYCRDDFFAYLEKQGNNPPDKSALDANSIDPHFFKTTDKVEPKFHEGQWITIKG